MLHWSSRNVKHSIRKLKKVEIREVYLSMVVSVRVKEREKERTKISMQWRKLQASKIFIRLISHHLDRCHFWPEKKMWIYKNNTSKITRLMLEVWFLVFLNIRSFGMALILKLNYFCFCKMTGMPFVYF